MLEVIVQNAEDAKRAEAYGADRMEVVSAISEGGLTPSYGAISEIVKSSKLEAMMMIRPHSFSFVYQEADIRAMKRDIEVAKEVGAAGIVFGALTKEGKIDTALLEQVIKWKGPLKLTFHRALEDASDIEEAYQVLRSYGQDIDQILTSGGTDSALDSLPRLKRWIEDSRKMPDSFQILVGSGVTSANIAEFQEALHHTDYHVGSGARAEGHFASPLDSQKLATLKAHILT
ncbi:copper homeostasis protein CutC [Listeria fleischmannii]|uniref:PF03932 family protein CutC n=1 Tax=Listeria fleischmannii FSL S10-1203 TaxID=1265822 RepID=W7DN03_9LIST|nr:copper homeostasis protein CutC [Listeria fleischmannii]EUJ55183.1 CutC family protein [Listeria fleischmannii FSL S10-1203]